MKRVDNRVSEEKHKEIQAEVEHHFQKCEDLWEEMIFELSMKLSLSEEVVRNIAYKV